MRVQLTIEGVVADNEVGLGWERAAVQLHNLGANGEISQHPGIVDLLDSLCILRVNEKESTAVGLGRSSFLLKDPRVRNRTGPSLTTFFTVSTKT